MAERIEYPPEPQGNELDQMQQIFRYLRRISEQLNDNQEVTDKNLSEYISAQASALRNITGTSETGKTETADIRELTAELVNTLQRMLKELQEAAGDTVTSSSFTGLFIEKARATAVTPVGSSTGFIIASAIKALQDLTEEHGAAIGKLKDEAGDVISGSWSGFLYSGVIGTDGNDDPIYGTAIGKDVVTWSGSTPTYHSENAWAIFRASGSTISGNTVPTPAEVIAKADKWAGATAETDIDRLTTPGKYFITADTNSQSNLPSSVTDGEIFMLETEADGNGHAMQKIWAEGKLYTRMEASNAWGNWYEFTGTML